ncbi:MULTISPECIES: methyl-accepting chemotaxis protein [Lysinibacillus]|uniref:HAMP domain-containing methyl-accepting chemotaxis protein n=1 Tax=Lysinibacillus irui TaxID=2998077 RepID=A0AAJ5RHQ8_9BACI|nr:MULTISPECIES: HAMP domain-containing methyl-accepting chemotaxis protein [Lysinibacillus]MEA0565456.1 HAMP domain-containing methyl-accepting chemotaxis protein [Lysinibacillus irui]WDV06377.1 HAMP domain-containing methyl-accepting chemotaxis protein [Lysinibacillus irui]
MKSIFQFKTLKARILSAFILLLVLVISFTTYTYNSNTNMEKQAKGLVKEDLVVLNASKNLALSMSVRLSAALNYVMTGDEKYKETFNEYREMAEENNAILDKYEKSEERTKLVEIARDWSNLVNTEVFDIYQKGNHELALENLMDTHDLVTTIRNGYEKLADERADAIMDVGNDVVSTSSNNRSIGIVVSLVLTIAGIVIAIITASIISKPVTVVANRMKELADGNLQLEPLVVKTRDEIGTLMASANDMNDKLKQTIHSIYTVSETVAASSEELAQSSNEVQAGTEQITITMQELASGTETQASTTGDLAETMNVFKRSIYDTTQEGVELKEHSSHVQNLTVSGKSLMVQSTKQMAAINDIMLDSVKKVESLNSQSAEISKLVSVIDDISNQTNLLALNAAIEAARAGEHGKGFAVVADEVRKLAEQVQFSVTDISTIVHRIQGETSNVTSALQMGYEEVKRGTTQLDQTNETFEQISSAVEDMIDNITTISTNLNSLAQNSDTINASIDDMASISQESAAGVEQTTATVEETAATMDEIARSANQLAGMAEELNNQLQQFKI